jgi:hypothetical protein
VAVSAQRALCADLSEDASESLAATASRVDRWLLVEYGDLWDRDVLGGSLLSAPLKEHLRDQLARLGHARLLFVKHPDRRSRASRMLFLGSSRPGEESLYALEFEEHDDLLEYDFAAALLDGGTPGIPLDHPLFVVCTHGKRDRCCAKYGQPLYDGLRGEVDGDWVWQSTHVGGDRFAGNVVVFPHGLYFGRVAPEDVGALLAEQAAGRLWLERYRGRSAYPFAVQAAEQTVRADEDLLGVDDVTVLDWKAEGDEWQVRLQDLTGAVHDFLVVEELSEEAVHLTCGASAPQRARRYIATHRRVRRR